MHPHFESIDGKKTLFVDWKPFTALTCEITWDKIKLGRTKETLGAYDALYPAAAELGLNAMKVPIKWSCVEYSKGQYDFSYPDHVIEMCRKHGMKAVLGWFGHYASSQGNMYDDFSGHTYAPMYIIEDEGSYPRAVDALGRSHHNCACYWHPAIVEAEIAAFAAFMGHLKEIDGDTGTVVLIQVENEIALFGMDRQNRAYWRDHHPLADAAFQACGHADELLFSAQGLCRNWLRPLTGAGRDVYDLPMFVNFVGGKLQGNIVGGSPGEDVATYMDELPGIDFCGLNMYVQPGRSTNDLWAALDAYSIGRNLPCLTECNSDGSGMAARLAFLSVASYGSPIFAPWALNTSYPKYYEPFVNEDGSRGPSWAGLNEPYSALVPVLELAARYGGTPRAHLFMPLEPGARFGQTAQVAGRRVDVEGQAGGQCIIIDGEDGCIYICGYRCNIRMSTPNAVYPLFKGIKAETGSYDGGWQASGELDVGLSQYEPSISISLNKPMAVRVSGL